jgi:hypothetical protein
LGLWKFYGDWDAVFAHAVAMHEDNRCEGITLCRKCHWENIHPGRTVVVSNREIHVDEWCAIPRNLEINFALGKKVFHRGEIGLLGFQSLMGLGWHVMSGQGRFIFFNRRRFAELLDKQPGVAFNRGLSSALDSLVDAGMVEIWANEGNDMEVYLAQEYVDGLKANPWFVPLSDVFSSSMSVLVLRWLLGFQSNRSNFQIGIKKLTSQMQLMTTSPLFVRKCVRGAVKEISWCEMEEVGDKFRFKFKKRGLIPVHSLREALSKSLDP